MQFYKLGVPNYILYCFYIQKYNKGKEYKQALYIYKLGSKFKKRKAIIFFQIKTALSKYSNASKTSMITRGLALGTTFHHSIIIVIKDAIIWASMKS